MLNRAWMEREAPLARCPLPACRRSGTCRHNTPTDPCRRTHQTRDALYNSIADKLDRMAVKLKEKMKDHHRGESAAKQEKFG